MFMDWNTIQLTIQWTHGPHSAARYIAKSTANLMSTQNLCTNTHGSISRNSPKVETIHMPRGWWMDEEKVLNSNSAILFSIKRNCWHMLWHTWILKTCHKNEARHKKATYTYYMILFTWNVQNKQIHRNRK